MAIIDRLVDKIADKITKTYSLNDPTLAAIAGWTKKDELQDAYSQLPTVYAAITAKARTLSMVPFYIYPKGGDEPVERGPVYDLFQNINPRYSIYDFWTSWVVGLDRKGEHYIYLDPETDRNGVPLNLWPFPKDMVKPLFDRNQYHVGWQIRRGKRTIVATLDEMIFDRYFNPNSDLEGLSPLEAVSKTTEVKWKAWQYNNNFFDNNAIPGIVVEGDKETRVNEQQRQRLEHQLFEQRKGVQKAHKGLLLTGGLTAKTLSFSQKDIEFLETLKLTTEEILQVLGVTKTQLSIMEDVNYATALTQDRVFMQKTIIPLGTQIETKLNQQFLNRFGYEGHFDWNQVDALNYEVLHKVEAAEKLFNIGFTANEINDRLNLGFKEQPWRDEPKPQQGMMELMRQEIGDLKQELLTEVKALPKEGPVENASKLLVESKRAEIWKNLNAPVMPLMSKAASQIREYFRDVEQKLLKRFTTGKNVKDVTDYINQQIDELDTDFDDERLRRLLSDLIRESVLRGGSSILGEFEGDTEPIQAMLNARLDKIKGINQTVVENLRKKLKDRIAEGIPEREATQKVLDTVKEQMKISRNRAKTIARTETHGAYSDGRWEAMSQTEPVGLMWISSRDSNVRDSHQWMDGTVTRFGQTFGNGLKRPHDPAGPADEVINCRCKAVAIHDPEEFRELGGR
jgi:HK97 family phage portal protein